MLSLASIARLLAVLFGLISAFCVMFPIIVVSEGTYRTRVILVVCLVSGGGFAILASTLYGCSRLVHAGGHSTYVHVVLWSFVAVAGLGGVAIALRVLWGMISAFIG